MGQVRSARVPVPRTFTASEVVCPEDDSRLWIVQHRKRIIHGLDESIAATFRDTRCTVEGCPLGGRRYRPAEEAMLVLPRMHFGLDVVTAVGSMRMREDASFPKIHARLAERGVPIAPMTVQYVVLVYRVRTAGVGRSEAFPAGAAVNTLAAPASSSQPRAGVVSSGDRPSPTAPALCGPPVRAGLRMVPGRGPTRRDRPLAPRHGVGGPPASTTRVADASLGGHPVNKCSTSSATTSPWRRASPGAPTRSS